ncbi:hypothetical protein AALD74_24135 [Lachnospiraceae bacterium 48-21]
MTCQKAASGKCRLKISGSSRFRHDAQREQWYSRLERFTALGGSVRPTVGVELPWLLHRQDISA